MTNWDRFTNILFILAFVAMVATVIMFALSIASIGNIPQPY